MKTSDLVRRINELITQGSAVLATRHRQGGDGDFINPEYVNAGDMKGFRAASLSFIQSIYGQQHPHFTEFDKNTNHTFSENAENGIAILQAIRSEISGGWMFTFKGLVAAELFADFLDMASHLLENGYKDSAAVMIGGVLEEHLRQLCLKHELAIDEEKDERVVPKKADRLNADLAKAGAYTKLDQSQVTTWMKIRNDAAHGKYDGYNHQQVEQFRVGVIEFMTRVGV